MDEGNTTVNVVNKMTPNESTLVRSDSNLPSMLNSGHKSSSVQIQSTKKPCMNIQSSISCKNSWVATTREVNSILNHVVKVTHRKLSKYEGKQRPVPFSA